MAVEGRCYKKPFAVSSIDACTWFNGNPAAEAKTRILCLGPFLLCPTFLLLSWCLNTSGVQQRLLSTHARGMQRSAVWEYMWLPRQVQGADRAAPEANRIGMIRKSFRGLIKEQRCRKKGWPEFYPRSTLSFADSVQVAAAWLAGPFASCDTHSAPLQGWRWSSDIPKAKP